MTMTAIRSEIRTLRPAPPVAGEQLTFEFALPRPLVGAGPAWAGPGAATAPPGPEPPAAGVELTGWAGPSAATTGDAEWARPDGPPIGSAPPVRATTSPEARRAAARFATLCLEVLNGFRPAGHVRPLASPTDASRVVDRLVVANHRLRRRRPAAQPPPELMKLRLLRVCEPRPGVVEAAASLGTQHRTWAMAFRLEQGAPNRWLGTALEVI